MKVSHKGDTLSNKEYRPYFLISFFPLPENRPDFFIVPPTIRHRRTVSPCCDPLRQLPVNDRYNKASRTLRSPLPRLPTAKAGTPALYTAVLFLCSILRLTHLYCLYVGYLYIPSYCRSHIPIILSLYRDFASGRILRNKKRQYQLILPLYAVLP